MLKLPNAICGFRNAGIRMLHDHPTLLPSCLGKAYSKQCLISAFGTIKMPLKNRAILRQHSYFSTSLASTTPPISFTSTSSRHFNKETPLVGYWLIGSGCLVFGIVLLGGLTRLTESGLSMTTWHPIKGMKPPITQQEWEAEFSRYQESPEFKLLNHNISLSDFKRIFYMEYAHRMWGRAIGLTFLLPALWFWRRGQFSSVTKKRVGVISGLIGFQGLLGWYMVKSGLSKELLEEPNSVPRVSQYRLAAHLGTAFVIYAQMLRAGWHILEQKTTRGEYFPFNKVISGKELQKFKKFRAGAGFVSGLIFLTALSGAFVAGLDAGLVYNEFPFMGDSIIPSSQELWSDLTANGKPVEKWRNLFENPTTVQLNHRLLGMTTLGSSILLAVASRRIAFLAPQVRWATHGMMGVALAQASLGIATLLYLVPIPLAATHQAGSLTLYTVSLWLMHLLKRLPK